MEALVISAGEPQLERCLKSVKNQTVPFSNIIHIADMVPQSKAVNYGIGKVTDEWLMKVDGDMTLYPNAVEMVTDYMSKNEGISMYCFAVHDDFLDADMLGCNVYQTSMFKLVNHKDSLKNDIHVEKKLKRHGYKRIKAGFTICIHAENPDEFQIFRRFYIYGVKYGKGYRVWRHTKSIFEATGDQRYDLALKALEFGMKNTYYPGSHNIDFDKKMFEEFKSNGN